ncbi:MAG: AAA family ATPase [Chloroflexales bacterium]|nr:AAA family ATPase [Chloroflexales bacterium]
MSEPIVPFDIAAERSLLGSILLDREAIVVVAPRLTPEFFYLEKHALIYVAMLVCYDQAIPPDLTTVAAELRRQGNLDIVGGLSALGALLSDLPTSVHAEYYADCVAKAALHRLLIEAGGKIAALGYDEQAGFEAALTSAVAELERITRAWSSREPITGISAAALARRPIEPVRWIIPELICEGFGYLAAKPGMGKTWMLLQWAQAVATGGRVLGCVPVERPGKVLFFALEDNESSLAERLRITFAGESWPENMICFHMESGPNKTLPLRPLDDGGLLQLDLQLRQNPDTAMIIIDTLTAVAPIHRQAGRSNAYADDYRGYLPLRSLADRYRIPIIGSWHYNKQGSIDPMEMVSGSMGLPAVGINRLGIVRDRDSEEALFCSFAKRGREVRWQVKYDPTTCQWVKLGDAKEHQLSEQKRAILDTLEEAGRPMRLADLVRSADMKYNNCIQLTKRMLADGLIVKRDSDGTYDLPGRTAKTLFTSPAPQIEAPQATTEELPPGCILAKCDHKGNRSLYGIYWLVLGPNGEGTEPDQNRDSVISTAWRRWG